MKGSIPLSPVLSLMVGNDPRVVPWHNGNDPELILIQPHRNGTGAVPYRRVSGGLTG
jgi:hypothetical protein